MTVRKKKENRKTVKSLDEKYVDTKNCHKMLQRQ